MQAAQELGLMPCVPVIPVEADEPHMAAAKTASARVQASNPFASYSV